MADDTPTHVALSASPLWHGQRQYFEIHGPRAWSSGTVPHYVTSNPYMARAFAEVVAGFAADCVRARPARRGEPRPLYIVELGAGSGKLGWNLIRALRTSVDAAAQGWRPIHVLTDICEETIAWWQQHPCLAPLIEAGLLDVARFDATCDDTLELRHSGHVIDRAHPTDEMVVVATYVFDSLPLDVFESSGGHLFEWLAATTPPAELDWIATEVTAPRYADPIHEAVLRSYLGAEGVFTLPSAALGALDRLRALCRGPLLVLSADKGSAHLAEVLGAGPPPIAQHGSISLSVNYHSLGGWTQLHNGVWMHSEHVHQTLEVCALVLGLADHLSTLASFDRAIAQRGPDDFYTLRRFIVQHAAELSPAELLAYLRLSGYDPKSCLDCADALRTIAATAGDRERASVALAINRIWDNYFPLGDDNSLVDLLADMIELLHAPDEPEAAISPVTDDPYEVASGRAAGIREVAPPAMPPAG